MTPDLPDITAAEVLRMHRENRERMDRLEREQKDQGETLTAMRETLARIDERTKKYEEGQRDIKDIEADLNKAKGAMRTMRVGGGFIGFGEFAHILWGFFHGH